MDCWDNCANAAIMWQCLPVPVFGDHASPTVRVATVGLNPSATEFLDGVGDWKPVAKRLPLLTDYAVRQRDFLSAANLEQAAIMRASYFKRTPHPWFSSLQGLLSTVNQGWNYATGTAVHVDLVACATWSPWGELSKRTTGELIGTCHKHLKRTLTELPDGTLLFLDGQTVNTTLADKFGVGERLEEQIGENELMPVWRGVLRIEGKSFKYIGWKTPVGWLSNWLYLARWVKGVTENEVGLADTQAEHWFQTGAQHQSGRGVTQNYVEAIKWFRKAAEQNHAEAQYRLGNCYWENYVEGVKQDYFEAIKWYRRAANQNHGRAQYRLGVCYTKGFGVQKDEVEAVSWYLKAANQNHDRAQYKLGNRYAQGRGVERDYAESVKWYRRAAEQGFSWTYPVLGFIYSDLMQHKYEGFRQAIPQDFCEAYKFLKLYAHGAKYLAQLASKMTPAEIEEGERRCREFLSTLKR